MKDKFKETLSNILSYLLKVERRTLLWENTSATAISAQTINLDLSDYDMVEVSFTVTESLAETEVFAKCRVGGRGLGQWWFVNQSVGTGYGAINSVAREFSATTSGVTFASGQMLYQGGSYFNWNNRCVPQRIYGIKYGGGTT